MNPIKVILANRRPGAFWSIEELFATIARAFPTSVGCTVVNAPRGRANLGSILANLRWAYSLRDGVSSTRQELFSLEKPLIFCHEA